MRSKQIIVAFASLVLLYTTTAAIAATAAPNYCQFSSTCYVMKTESYTSYCYEIGKRLPCTLYRSVLSAAVCYRLDCCKGFTGDVCLEDINECDDRNGGCSHHCRNTYGSFECYCNNGFIIDTSTGKDCIDKNECEDGNGGCSHHCRNTHGSFECYCDSGFDIDLTTGTYCIEINECEDGNGGCLHHCRNTHGSFECYCETGFVIDSTKKDCIDINECDDGNGGCSHHCRNTYGSFECYCDSGFVIDPSQTDCIDNNECDDGNGGCSHHCRNTNGSFECYCESGFEIDPTAKKDCIDLDECLTRNGGCEQECVNEVGSFHCECRNGFELTPDRQTCADINECLSTSRCSHKCNNNVGSYTCECNLGFRLASDGFTCVDDDNCIGVECRNGASCVDGTDTFFCKCLPGFEGVYCEKDIDECSYLNGGCEETCINKNGSFACQCLNGVDDYGLCKQASNESFLSILEIFKIPRKLLPRGCAVLTMTLDEQASSYKSILFASTDYWYRFSYNASLLYTLGIVYLEKDNIQIPISAAGLTLVNKTSGFELLFGIKTNLTDVAVNIGDRRTGDCFMLPITLKDIPELLRSFTPTFFTYVSKALPTWIDFELLESKIETGLSKRQILSITDLRTDLLHGRDLRTHPDCSGAPLYNSRIYNVFLIGTDFNITLFQIDVSLFQPFGANKLCILLDISADKAKTVFILLPPESRQILSRFQFMQSLNSSIGLQFQPRGIGLSLSGDINVDLRDSMKFWNGHNHFNYRPMKQAKLWLGTDFTLLRRTHNFDLTVGGRADIYVDTGDLNKVWIDQSSVVLTLFICGNLLLTGIFVDKWTVLLRITELTAMPTVKFEVLGIKVVLEFFNIINVPPNVMISIGGTSNRIWCDDDSYPEGVYASFYANINPFKNIPIMKDWLFDFNTQVFGFVATSINSALFQKIPHDILQDILRLRDIVHDFKTLLANYKDKLKGDINETAEDLINILNSTTTSTINLVDDFVSLGHYNASIVTAMVFNLWQTIKDGTINIYHQLIDALAFDIHTLVHELKEFLKEKIDIITQSIYNIIKKTREEIFQIDKYMTGFGIKFSADIHILGLGFGQADVEFVKSTKNIGECSRFQKAYSLLQDEDAVRISARIAKEKNLGFFIKFKKSYFLSVAFAKYERKFVVHFNADINCLGIKLSADVLINNDILIFQIEGNAWDVFYARIRFEASLGGNWYSLNFKVQGEFLVKKGDNDFSGSYLDGLRLITQNLANEANKRLDMAIRGLQNAQNKLSEANGHLSSVQETINNANLAFDKAVNSLQTAQKTLEEAKQPFINAVSTLQQARRRVDNLCRMRSCPHLCIPGIRIEWCRSGWIGYPCIKWTNCMIKIPDLFCELRNAICWAIRILAYSLLQVAEFVFKTVLLALDAAKLVVSVAEYAVDASRVVLILAQGLLEIAKVALEVAKAVIELAKIAVTTVKFLLNAALYVFDLIVKYGIQSLIDVRNCRFELYISTFDKKVFDVSCEVRAFSLDWQLFRFEFDFNNPITSMWRMTKATVESLFRIVTQLLGKRKRREISYDAMGKLHHILQVFKRSTDVEFNSSEFYDLYNNSFTQDSSSYLDDRFKNKIEYFSFNCDVFKRSHSFLYDSIERLLSMVVESVDTIERNTSSTKDSIHTHFSKFNAADGNQTAESYGIDIEYAYREFNISQEQIDIAIQDVLSNFTEDPYVSQIRTVADDAADKIDKESSNAYTMSLTMFWVHGMENITKEHFDESKCYGLQDCVLYAFSELYEVFNDNSIQYVNESRTVTSNLEDQFLFLLSNDSWTIKQSFDISVNIKSQLDMLNGTNPWCSTAPVITSNFVNQTTLIGSTVKLTCYTTGDPSPFITWYFNESMVENENDDEYIIHGISRENQGKYSCEAENLLNSVKSNDMFLKITECQPGSYFDGKRCILCKKGYFQPLVDQLHCLKCNADYTTKPGASHRSECYKNESSLVTTITVVVGVLIGLGLIVVLGVHVLKAISKRNKINPFKYQDQKKRSPIFDDLRFTDAKTDVVNRQTWNKTYTTRATIEYSNK